MGSDVAYSSNKELSSAKWLTTELAERVSAEAIRLHGAYGCAEVVNESLEGAYSFSFGKILRQVKGGAIKSGIARLNSCRECGNPKECNCR